MFPIKLHLSVNTGLENLGKPDYVMKYMYSCRDIEIDAFILDSDFVVDLGIHGV